MSTISWPLNGNASGYSGGGFKGVTNSQRGFVNLRAGLGQVIKTAGGRGMGGVDIVIIGNSIAECNLAGTGVANAYASTGLADYMYSRWSHYLKVLLQNALNPPGVQGGYGFLPVYTGAAYTGAPAGGVIFTNFGTAPGAAHGVSEKANIYANGANGTFITLDPTSVPAERRLNVTDIDIVGATAPVCGTIRYDVKAGGTGGAAMIGTGGVTGTINTNTASIVTYGVHNRVTGITRTVANTYQVAGPATTNNLYFDGMIFYDNDYDCGIRVHNIAKWGAINNVFSSIATGGASDGCVQASITQFGSGTPGTLAGANQAKLFIFEWITNDIGTGVSPVTPLATFITRYANQVDNALALPSKPSVLLVIPPCRNNANALANYPAFVSAIYTMASTRPDVAILDLWAYCNNDAYTGAVTTFGWNGDGTHYSDIAQREWAQMMFSLITN